MKKRIIFISSIVLIVVLIIGGFLFIKHKNETQKDETQELLDSEKFAQEYTKVSTDNVFVYKTLEEINKILENGTGIVYIGYPKCPWCQEYVKYLNEAAKEYGIEKIYYFNNYDVRNNVTDEYRKTLNILDEYLHYDDEGNKRIYVPAVISINNGKITGYDDETAWDTKGYETAEEYWANEDLDGLKNRLNEMFKSIEKSYCTTDCND